MISQLNKEEYAMPRPKMIVEITEADFVWLGAQSGISEKDMKSRFADCKDEKERFDYFCNLMDRDPRNWEYVMEANADKLREKLDGMLPVEIRNSGDIDDVENYLKKSGNTLATQAKCMLIKRLDALYKAADINEEAQKRAEGKPVFSNRFRVTQNGKDIKDGDKIDPEASIQLVDARKKERQNARNGCFSVSMEMMLSGAGVQNVYQTDIRNYRPHFSKKKLQSSIFTSKKSAIDQAYNSFSLGGEVPEMADSLLAFAPDSMMRVCTIEGFVPGEKKFAGVPMKAYIRGAVMTAEQQIRYALAVDKAPIALNIGGHYVTITGIRPTPEGPVISYDDPASDTNESKLSDIIGNLVSNGNYINLVWLSDINLAKDGKTIHGVPSEYVSMNEDGSLTLPPEAIRESVDRYKGAQENDCVRVGRYAGAEDSIEMQEKRRLPNKNGVITAETVILPKKLNAQNLRRKAEDRSIEKEKLLIENGKMLYGVDYVSKPRRSVDDTDRDIKRPRLENADVIKKPADDFAAAGLSSEPVQHRMIMSEVRLARHFKKQMESEIKRAERRERSLGRLKEFRLGMGKDAMGYGSDTAFDGKRFIWNEEGASAAFQLKFVMESAEPLYKAMGKEKEFEEFKKEYEKLKQKLVPISDEDGKHIAGYRDGGVIIPGVGKIDTWFKDEEAIGEAVVLMGRIESLDIRKTFGNAPFNATGGDYSKYDPSILSLCADNLTNFAKVDQGNYLRLCGEDPAAYTNMKRMVTLPTDDKALLTKTKSTLSKENDNVAESFITMGIAMRNRLKLECRLQRCHNSSKEAVSALWRKSSGRTYIEAGDYAGMYGQHELMFSQNRENLVSADGKYANDKAKSFMEKVSEPAWMSDYEEGANQTIKNSWRGKYDRAILGVVNVVAKEFKRLEAKGDKQAAEVNAKTVLQDIMRYASQDEKKFGDRCVRSFEYFIRCYNAYKDHPGFDFVRQNETLMNEISYQYFRMSFAEKAGVIEEEFKKREAEARAREEEKRRREAEQRRKQNEKLAEKKLEDFKDELRKSDESALKFVLGLDERDKSGNLNEVEKLAKEKFYDYLKGSGGAFYAGRLLRQAIKPKYEAYRKLGDNVQRFRNIYQNGQADTMGLPDIGYVSNNPKLLNFVAKEIAKIEFNKEINTATDADKLYDILQTDRKKEQEVMRKLAEEEGAEGLLNWGLEIMNEVPDGNGIRIYEDNGIIKADIPQEIAERERFAAVDLVERQQQERDNRGYMTERICGQDGSIEEKAAELAGLTVLTSRRDDLKPDIISNKEMLETRNADVEREIGEMKGNPHLYVFTKRLVDKLNKDEIARAQYSSDNGANIVIDWNQFAASMKARTDEIINDRSPLVTAPENNVKEKYTIDELRSMCESTISKTRDKKHLKYQEDIKQAADIVTLNYLISPGAKRMFFGKGTDWKNEEEKL